MKKIADESYYLKNSTTLGWGEGAKLDKERLSLLAEFLKKGSVLDVACGKGLYVDYLSSKGFESFGVDLVKEFVDEGNKRGFGKFFKGKAENLPFKDLQFDNCLLFDILEHGEDVKILNEAKRVTMKKILAIVPRTVDKNLADSGVIFRHYLDKSHLREYQRKNLEELADNCGLKLSFLKEVHPLHNETVFMSLFGGPVILKKIIRKIVFFILPKEIYPTEYFVVFEK